MEALVLASEFVSGVNLDVAFRTKSCFVGATDNRRRSILTHITLYLHLIFSQTTVLDLWVLNQEYLNLRVA